MPFEKQETHPAFGKIGISRFHGGTGNFFGSDLHHNGGICIKIQTAKISRELSRDWIFGDKHVATIEMSHAQFAELITSLNIGDGVPCTLRWTQELGNVPPLPDKEAPFTKYKAEVSEAAEGAITALENAMKAVDEQKMTNKAKDAIKKRLTTALQSLRSSVPFVVESMKEKMDKMTTDAKTEFEAWATHAVQRAGLEALARDDKAVALPKSEESTR